MSDDTWIVDSMVEKRDPSFSGKSRGNILRFLKECISGKVDPKDQDSDTAMIVLMDRYLDASVIVDPKLAGELTSVLTHVYKEVSAQAGFSVRRYLLDANTPVSALREIKEHHQRIARTGPSEAERRVATAIYFGAIAGALVFHRERITSYSNEDLKKSIRKLLDRPWMDPELKSLLQQADTLLEG